VFLVVSFAEVAQFLSLWWWVWAVPPDYNNRGQACWRVSVCLLTNMEVL